MILSNRIKRRDKVDVELVNGQIEFKVREIIKNKEID